MTDHDSRGAIAQALNDLPGQFLVGWNIPGYLPSMEPMEADSFGEAKIMLIDELQRSDDDDTALLAEEVNLWTYDPEQRQWQAHDDDLVYWIMEVQ